MLHPLQLLQYGSSGFYSNSLFIRICFSTLFLFFPYHLYLRLRFRFSVSQSVVMTSALGFPFISPVTVVILFFSSCLHLKKDILKVLRR